MNSIRQKQQKVGALIILNALEDVNLSFIFLSYHQQENQRSNNNILPHFNFTEFSRAVILTVKTFVTLKFEQLEDALADNFFNVFIYQLYHNS